MNLKPGLRSSEFWLVALLILAQLVSEAVGLIDNPQLTLVATTALGGFYSIARGLAKARGVTVPTLGVKSTEFWVTAALVLLQLLGLALGYIQNPTLSVVAATVLGGCYAIARGLAKSKGIAVPAALDKPPGS